MWLKRHLIVILSIGMSIIVYLALSFKWSERPLSVWPLWMWAYLISAHDAPKRLWVSNMIQQSMLDSPVAAAYILIISRELERCRGSSGLHQPECYQSLVFQRRGEAGPFRGHVWHIGFSVTLSVTQFPILTRWKAPWVLCVSAFLIPLNYA